MADEAKPEPEPEAAKKVVRLPEPDREAQQAQIQELQDQIQGKKSRLDEIRALIEGKNAKRKGVRDGSSELRDELKAIRGRRNGKIEEKKAIRAQMQELKRVDLPSKKDQPKMNAEQIVRKIHDLEQRQHTETLTLKEEKTIMLQVKELRAQVGAVSAFAVNIEKLKSDRESYDVSRKSFSAQLTEKDAEIDAIKAEEEVVVAKLDKKNAAADSHGSDIPELIKEREELRPDVPKIYEQIKALRDEFKKEGDLWWETERAFRTQERAADQAKWEAQKDKRAAEYEENRKFRYDESTSQGDVDPYDEDKSKCDVLTAYLTTLLPAVAAEAVVEAKIDHGGATVMGKKGASDDESYWNNLQAKSKKKKGKKGGQTKPKGDMTHPVERLNALNDLGIAPPFSMDDVRAAVAEVAKKKAVFIEKGSKIAKPVVREYRPLICRVRVMPVGDKDIKIVIEPVGM